VNALLITHCHIDRLGRIPYLLAAGFRGPIYATTVITATMALLPSVIEDALKVGVTRNKNIIYGCSKLLKNQIIPLEYKQWQEIELNQTAGLKPSSLAYGSSSPFALNSSPSVQNIPIYPEFFEGEKEGVEGKKVKIKLQPAGHILDSAYVEIDIQNVQNKKDRH
jgi:metallo-beta-lactamase family protein